jgi:tripartite-type tricarboxylate transporter receptor subunit TctC
MKAATGWPRRRLILVAPLALTAWAVVPRPATAQAYPSKPIRLVVPFPPGGPTDIVARPLGLLLSDALQQPVIIDNRAGAGGSVGAGSVAKSLPDGYTLLMGTVGTNAINGALYAKLPYDPMRDFTPIALVASAPVAVVVNSAAPIMSVKELIAQAAASPGRMAFGSAGNGTPGHLTGEMFAAATGVKFQHVPYKGSAQALNDLLGNQIPVMFDPLQSVIQHVRAGKLRALAISSRTRSPALPDVPTLAEADVKGLDAAAWWAVFAPANLPDGVAARLRAEIERIARSDAFRDRLGSLGVQPAFESVSLADFQKSEVAKWGKAVRDSGAVAD